MKFDWESYIGQTLNVTMHENYGITSDPKSDTPIYEIVFKSGKLVNAYENGILLETEREETKVKIYIPLSSIKCVEIFNF
ncbi:MAG TPA: hypothetical protein ENI57_05110 [Ignavibacteria bacterium]|nr:hypothetical protein [Ignavibacteria bacterium]